MDVSTAEGARDSRQSHTAATLQAMEPWAKVFRLAARQYGAVASSQVEPLGIDDATFIRHVRRERWAQPHRGVFLVPGTRHGFLTMVSAALLAVGDHAVTTAETALHLRGLTKEPPARVVLVMPHSHRARSLKGVRVIRSRTLTDDDRTTARGLACVTAQRAFIDAAPAYDRRALRVMLIDARQREVVNPAEVIARAVALPSRTPGRGRLIEAAHDVDAVGADSVLSDLVHRRLLEEGLEPDPHSVAVRAESGRHLHPDITFEHASVCIECDSLAHHSTQQAIDLDHRKNEAYSQARGSACGSAGAATTAIGPDLWTPSAASSRSGPEWSPHWITRVRFDSNVSRTAPGSLS